MDQQDKFFITQDIVIAISNSGQTEETKTNNFLALKKLE